MLSDFTKRMLSTPEAAIRTAEYHEQFITQRKDKVNDEDMIKAIESSKQVVLDCRKHAQNLRDK